MGKTIKNQIPWTKDLYNAFVEDAILTDLEKKVLYCRVWEKEKWTIISMSLEFHVGKSTINNAISSIRSKYDYLYYSYPDKYPKRITSKAERREMLDKMKIKRE